MTGIAHSAPTFSVLDDARRLRLAMVAGEASGDLLAGLLLDGLKERWPT